jgi:hypothetical protein
MSARTNSGKTFPSHQDILVQSPPHCLIKTPWFNASTSPYLIETPWFSHFPLSHQDTWFNATTPSHRDTLVQSPPHHLIKKPWFHATTSPISSRHLGSSPILSLVLLSHQDVSVLRKSYPPWRFSFGLGLGFGLGFSYMADISAQAGGDGPSTAT